MLDAHTDILTELSVTDDFEGFTAIVTPPNDFPLMFQQGFGIKTGKSNSDKLVLIFHWFDFYMFIRNKRQTGTIHLFQKFNIRRE